MTFPAFAIHEGTFEEKGLLACRGCAVRVEGQEESINKAAAPSNCCTINKVQVNKETSAVGVFTAGPYLLLQQQDSFPLNTICIYSPLLFCGNIVSILQKLVNPHTISQGFSLCFSVRAWGTVTQHRGISRGMVISGVKAL